MKKTLRWYWNRWHNRPNKKPGIYRWIFLAFAILGILLYIDVSRLQVYRSPNEKYDSIEFDEDAHAHLITKSSHQYWIPYDLGVLLCEEESNGIVKSGDNIDLSWYSTVTDRLVSEPRRIVGLRIGNTLYFRFQSTQEVRDEKLYGAPLMIVLLLFLFFINYIPSLWWLFRGNKSEVPLEENVPVSTTEKPCTITPTVTYNFPIKLSGDKSILYIMGVFWTIFIYTCSTDFEEFSQILPLSIALIIFFGYGTISIWKMVRTTIIAEQNYFLVKSGKHQEKQYLYSDVTEVAYTNSKVGPTYSVYVGDTKVVVFDSFFENYNEFWEILQSQDVIIGTYPKLLWERIIKKIKSK